MSVFAPVLLAERESKLFCNSSSQSPRDHNFPAMCSSEEELSCLCCSLKGAAAGQLQLHWLRNLEMWVKTVRLVLVRLLFLTPYCREGAGHRDCRCRLWTREQANRW